tara:strand:+ start:776 stop:1129 length:354 start_codon:yes stop_codon:yes gene_type:complete
MKQSLKFATLIIVGVAIGVPLGRSLTSKDTEAVSPTRRPDAINITLPRDYFAQLPESPDGQHRLISVDTFTFNGTGGNGVNPGDEIVLPRFVFSEMSDSYRERFVGLLQESARSVPH